MKKVFEMLCKELGNAAGTLIMIIAFFTGYCSFFTKQMYTCPDIGVVCDNYSQFKDIYELIAEEILGISAITSKGIALCREKINYYGDTAIPFFCSETDVNVKNVNAALVSRESDQTVEYLIGFTGMVPRGIDNDILCIDIRGKKITDELKVAFDRIKGEFRKSVIEDYTYLEHAIKEYRPNEQYPYPGLYACAYALEKMAAPGIYKDLQNGIKAGIERSEDLQDEYWLAYTFIMKFNEMIQTEIIKKFPLGFAGELLDDESAAICFYDEDMYYIYEECLNDICNAASISTLVAKYALANQDILSVQKNGSNKITFTKKVRIAEGLRQRLYVLDKNKIEKEAQSDLGYSEVYIEEYKEEVEQ